MLRPLALASLWLCAVVWSTSLALAETNAQTFARNRTRLERMSAEQRREMWEKHQRFLGLSPAEQQRIRKLYADLRRRPSDESDRLRRVMLEYKKWKDGLPLYQRQELEDAVGKGSIELYSAFQDVRKRQEIEEKLRPYWLLRPEARGWAQSILPKLTPEEVEMLDQASPLERPEKLFAYGVQYGVIPPGGPARPMPFRRGPLPPIEDERLREFARKLPRERLDEIGALGRKRIMQRVLELYYESHPDELKERLKAASAPGGATADQPAPAAPVVPDKPPPKDAAPSETKPPGASDTPNRPGTPGKVGIRPPNL